HHYLLFLLLLVSCFVPWDGSGGRDGQAEHAGAGAENLAVTGWALRLLFVQMSIVYGWAAVAKLEPLWLDGTTLAGLVRSGWMRVVIDALGAATVAWLVVAAELFLAAALLVRRLWPFALAVGLGLHWGIQLTDLEIGLFSYFM